MYHLGYAIVIHFDDYESPVIRVLNFHEQNYLLYLVLVALPFQNHSQHREDLLDIFGKRLVRFLHLLLDHQ